MPRINHNRTVAQRKASVMNLIAARRSRGQRVSRTRYGAKGTDWRNRQFKSKTETGMVEELRARMRSSGIAVVHRKTIGKNGKVRR